MPNSLNAAQRTALAVTLSGFERSLRQASSWLDGGRSDGIMHHSSLELPPAQRQAAQTAIDQALELIAQLAQRFTLDPAHEPLASRIAAEMSVSWANLVDARAAKLKRYGAVDPTLHESLDSDLDRLSRLALLISSQVTGAQSAPDE